MFNRTSDHGAHALNYALLRFEPMNNIRRMLADGARPNADTLDCAVIGGVYGEATFTLLIEAGALPKPHTFAFAKSSHLPEEVNAALFSFGAQSIQHFTVNEFHKIRGALFEKYLFGSAPLTNLDEINHCLRQFRQNPNDEDLQKISKHINVLICNENKLNPEYRETHELIMEFAIITKNYRLLMELLPMVRVTTKMLNRAIFTGVEDGYLEDLVYSGAQPNSESLNCALFSGCTADFIMTLRSRGAMPNYETRKIIEFSCADLNVKRFLMSEELKNEQKTVSPVTALEYCHQHMPHYIYQYGQPTRLMQLAAKQQKPVSTEEIKFLRDIKPFQEIKFFQELNRLQEIKFLRDIKPFQEIKFFQEINRLQEIKPIPVTHAVSSSQGSSQPISRTSDSIAHTSARFIELGVKEDMARFIAVMLPGDQEKIDAFYAAWLDVANIVCLMPDEFMAQWLSGTMNNDWRAIDNLLQTDVECDVRDAWKENAAVLFQQLREYYILNKPITPTSDIQYNDIFEVMIDLIHNPYGVNEVALNLAKKKLWKDEYDRDPKMLPYILDLSVAQCDFMLFCCTALKIKPTTETLNRALFVGADPCFIFKMLKDGVQPDEQSLNCALFGNHPVAVINLLLEHNARPNADTAQYVEYSNLPDGIRIVINRGAPLINPNVSSQIALKFCWNNMTSFASVYGIPRALIDAVSGKLRTNVLTSPQEIARFVEQAEARAAQQVHTSDVSVSAVRATTRPSSNNDDDGDEDVDDKPLANSRRP